MKGPSKLILLCCPSLDSLTIFWKNWSLLDSFAMSNLFHLILFCRAIKIYLATTGTFVQGSNCLDEKTEQVTTHQVTPQAPAGMLSVPALQTHHTLPTSIQLGDNKSRTPEISEN